MGSIESILPMNGIQEKHQNEDFLLQRKNCPPNSECTVDRIYQDGSFYFYDEKSETWTLVTSLKTAGLLELTAILESHCNILETPSTGASAMGTMEYIFNVKDCSRKVIIYGVDYGKFAALEEISTVINANLNPIKLE